MEEAEASDGGWEKGEQEYKDGKEPVVERDSKGQLKLAQRVVSESSEKDWKDPMTANNAHLLEHLMKVFSTNDVLQELLAIWREKVKGLKERGSRTGSRRRDLGMMLFRTMRLRV